MKRPRAATSCQAVRPRLVVPRQQIVTVASALSQARPTMTQRAARDTGKRDAYVRKIDGCIHAPVMWLYAVRCER